MTNRRSRRTLQVSGSGWDRTAAAAVEFAVVANVVFLLIFTCIEFARVNMVRNLTQDAAYFAARQAMVPGATSEEAIAEAERILGVVGPENFSVTVNDGAGLDGDTREISVTVSVDIDDVALFTPMFFGNQTISSTATMATERYNRFFNQ